ncbi:MAG TPA: HlyD family secretion protein [Pirellulales bacterium]|nr:HlyD family secretion protein [Pirellulales bacterium]
MAAQESKASLPAGGAAESAVQGHPADGAQAGGHPPDGHAATATHVPSAAKPAKSRRGLWMALGVVATIAACYFLVPITIRAMTTVSTDDAYVNGHVTSVAARVPGQVIEVLVDDNYRVRKGDVLVKLDREPYEIQLSLQQATLETAQADLVAAQDRVRGIVAQARSSRFRLEHAMEDVRNQQALLQSNVAQLKAEEANLALAERDFARGESLIGTGAISKQQFDQYKAAYDVAKNRVASAEQAAQQTRASLGLQANNQNPLQMPENLDQTFSTVRQALADVLVSAAPLGIVPTSYDLSPKQLIEEFYKRDPEGNLDRIYAKLIADAAPIKQATAKVHQAEADVAQAKLNLRYCDVLAEIDGVVTRRNVNPGNNVQAGQALMAIRSLTEIWVDANFKETQLARLRIGQPVDIKVDMYGSQHHFRGRISGFTMGTGSTLALLPPQNATGNFVKVVQRLPVRIDLEDYNPDEHTLFVGLSVVPYVHYREAPTGPNAGQRLQEVIPEAAREAAAAQQAPSAMPSAPSKPSTTTQPQAAPQSRPAQ